MTIVLKDSSGRRLRLGDACLIEGGVLYYRRLMLVAIGEGLRLPPAVLEVINASVAGSTWLPDDEDVRGGYLPTPELSFQSAP